MKDRSMDLVEHLDELRKRLLITVGAFLLFFITGFVFVKDIYSWLVRDLEMKLTVLSPTEIIWAYLMISGVFALALTIPIFAFQLWLFVRPALKQFEQKVALAYIPALFFCFIAGLSFGFFIILPVVFHFLIGLGDEVVITMFTTEKYFNFIFSLILPFGFLFELPILVMFLTSIGILSPHFLRKNRKYAYFVLVVISVLISPPDFFSDVLVIIPLLFLYECSIVLSAIVDRKRKRKLDEDEDLNVAS